MLVSGVSLDLSWFLQFIVTVFIVAAGFLYLVKNTASKYFEVDANFEGDQPTDRTPMPNVPINDAVCASCGNSATKKCSRCKAVRYCSQRCQESHWKSEHKKHCKDFYLSNGIRQNQNGVTNRGYKSSAAGKNSSGVALVPVCGTSRPIKKPKDVLFPYDEFVKIFNWQKLRFPPCGLLNCGNSCFANVVLQCLSFTRPLVAYSLEKGHRRECRLNDWCFLCEFQTHVERASRSTQAFSPDNILSRLPSIGVTLGYGRQEDAHEFMRFAIDTMQSVCLDEFGGEKSVPPSLQETTLIQHIFGGHLQSQVICTNCEKISNQYENMMDLTVEIQGEAASLEECLDQFTGKEWLHGDNMYKCDGCNDYVKACKRLTVKQSPNILTIALKRFQSGRFGKLNKRITFPETLDLSPYMSEEGDGSDKYNLYAVVVHLDMLNASFFGHYICYIKDFQGNWYKIDDWKVISVELEEVLSQGAYMLLYSRVSARPSGLRTVEFSGKEEEQRVEVELEASLAEQAECLSRMETLTSRSSEVMPYDGPVLNISDRENGSGINKDVRECSDSSEDIAMIGVESTSDVACENSCGAVESFCQLSSQPEGDLGDINMVRSNPYSETSSCMEEQDGINMPKSGPYIGLPNHFSCIDEDSSVPIDHVSGREESEHRDVINVKSSTRKGYADYGNEYASGNQLAIPLEDAHTVISGSSPFPIKTSSAEMHQLKQGLPLSNSETGEGSGINRAEI